MSTDTKRHILIGEDDPFLASLIKDHLEKNDFSVTVVSHGPDILKTIAEKQPDLVLLDVVLPGVLGFDILRDAKSNEATAKIPVMMMSNLGDEVDLTRAKELGAEHYFLKGDVNLDELIAHVKAFFE